MTRGQFLTITAISVLGSLGVSYEIDQALTIPPGQSTGYNLTSIIAPFFVSAVIIWYWLWVCKHYFSCCIAALVTRMKRNQNGRVFVQNRERDWDEVKASSTKPGLLLIRDRDGHVYRLSIQNRAQVSGSLLKSLKGLDGLQLCLILVCVASLCCIYLACNSGSFKDTGISVGGEKLDDNIFDYSRLICQITIQSWIYLVMGNGKIAWRSYMQTEIPTLWK